MNEVLNFGELGQTEGDRVETYLGDKVICFRCGATLESYANKCDVPLNVPCEGFLLIEGVRLHIRRVADA